MDSLTLLQIIGSDSILKESMTGIYSLDTIPGIFELNKGFIFNTETSQVLNKGHWILCFYYMKGNLKCFDFLCSFASKISEFPSLENEIRKSADIIFEIPYPIQLESSSSCGSYCLYFAFFCSRQFYGKQIVKHFFSPQLFGIQRYINDLLVIFFVKAIFPLDSWSVAKLLFNDSFLNNNNGEQS